MASPCRPNDSVTYPFMPAIVMTAFATPAIEEKINITGTAKLREKPVEFERLAEAAILDGLQQEGKEGGIAGTPFVQRRE
jgi:hypothetical protein